jgi:signal transduction histidine kinase
MAAVLTFEVAVVLMILGAIPSFINVYLLWGDRNELGVFWFILSMATGGLWALLYTLFTVVPSPEATLALANFFWPLVPTAALTMFLLAYEFVFKQPVSRVVAVVMFSPIALLFVLSWSNPNGLVFTADYYVGADGYLYFPNFDGPLKILVTQVYGYLLVALAAGMFVGEAMRTNGIRRKRVLYLLGIFTMLVASTMVKVAGLVPVFFDPTSVVYSASGLLFAYSINKYGLFKSISIGREQSFEEVDDAIIVVDEDDVVVDVNQRGCELFREDVVGDHIRTIIPQYGTGGFGTGRTDIRLPDDEQDRYFHCKTSPIEYGRHARGTILILGDVTTLKRQEQELHLLVQIFSRVYRHNMRNDFNIIQGYAEMLKQQPSEEVTQLADQIDARTDKILQQATKARQVEKVFLSDETVSRSLRALVAEGTSSFDCGQKATVRTAVDDVTVEVNPRFHLALRELLDNAVAHHPGTGTVEVDIYSEETEESAFLVIADNGTGIPEYELDVLQAAEETDLQHSSGIGLWLVRAVVTRSNGDLSVESTAEGTTIRIRLSKSNVPKRRSIGGRGRTAPQRRSGR